MTKNRLTSSDIAKKAGVSRTFVSLYLNGRAKEQRLSESSIQKVQAAIKELHYTPNFHARAIKLKRTFLIGVIVPSSSFESFWNEIFAGIERQIMPRDYHMVLGISDNSIDRERDLFDFMFKKGVDGIIYAPAIGGNAKPGAYPLEMAKRIPVVSILFPMKELPSVYTDNEEGGRIAARHLLKMGHSDIAYLGPLAPKTGNHGNRRHDGAWHVLSKAGATLTHYPDIPSLMKRLGQHSAVFCFSDFHAAQLYKECMKSGIRIPDDISVVGFDNMDFISFLYPELTTIHQNKSEVGLEAARILLESIEDKKLKPDSIKFCPVLKPGASVLGRCRQTTQASLAGVANGLPS